MTDASTRQRRRQGEPGVVATRRIAEELLMTVGATSTC